MVEEFSMQKSEAPFNMALATLEALRKILAHIEEIYMNPLIHDDLKQKIKINLVKRFYVDSGPLLGRDISKKYIEILSLKPVELVIVDNNSGNNQNKQKKREVYDFEMEVTLDTYLLELQLELQDLNYYMPPRRNLGKIIGSF